MQRGAASKDQRESPKIVLLTLERSAIHHARTYTSQAYTYSAFCHHLHLSLAAGSLIS